MVSIKDENTYNNPFSSKSTSARRPSAEPQGIRNSLELTGLFVDSVRRKSPFSMAPATWGPALQRPSRRNGVTLGRPLLELQSANSLNDLELVLYPEPFACGSDTKIYAAVNAKAPEEQLVVKVAKKSAMAEAEAANEMTAAQLAESGSAPVLALSTAEGTCLVMRPAADHLHKVIANLPPLTHEAAGGPAGALRCALTVDAMWRPLKHLANLHENGRVHGDIKPDNFHVIRRDAEVTLHLGDFGASSDSSSPSSNGDPYISPEFKPPEHYADEAQEELESSPSSAASTASDAATPAGDIWAAGLTLLMVATGEHLLGLQTDLQVDSIDRWQNIFLVGEQLQAYRAAGPDASCLERLQKVAHPGLRRLIGRMLDVDPQQRPSARVVHDELFAMAQKLSQTPALDDARRFLARQNALQQRTQPQFAYVQAELQGRPTPHKV